MANCPIPLNGFEEFPIVEMIGNIPHRFESQAKRQPDKIAIEWKRQSWTYRTLNQSANRIARAIRAREMRNQFPVALLFSPGPVMVTAILGVLKAGGAWVPIMQGSPIERAQALLAETGSGLLLTTGEFIDEAQAIASEHAEILPIERIISSGNGENLELAISPDTISNIIFTSGSTGRPKGVVHTHAVVLNNIMVHTNALYLNCNDRICQVASYTTLAGTSSIFRALLNGATLLPFDITREGPNLFARWLIEARVTVCQIVPTLFRSMIESLDESATFPDMRVFHLGGEPVYRNDVRNYRIRFPETCRLLHNLGSSEAPTIRQFFVDHDTPIGDERLPVGYPVPDREVLIVDDAGELVGPEKVGEIVVRSRYLAQGYWHQPSLTRESFELEPDRRGMRRYRTGDLGSMSQDGCLKTHGRKDQQIKVHGHRVELEEIEAVLSSLDGIDQAAVNLILEKGRDRLVAYIVTSTAKSLPEELIRQQLRKKLPNHMIPGRFVTLSKLPLTSTGKIDRMALAFPSTSYEVTTMTPPSNEIEQWLCDLWGEVLGHPVGISDHFLDIGGDSMCGAKIISRIAAVGFDLSMKDLFDHPTVAAMARLLNGKIQL